MNKNLSLFIIILVIGVLSVSCASGAAPDPQEIAAAFQKGGCTACHVIPGIPGAVGTIGPDLSDRSGSSCHGPG